MNRIPSSKFIPFSVLLLIFSGFSLSLSQTKSSPDTTKKSPSGVDTVVVYSASDSITYSLSTRMMNLYGKGNVKYRKIELKSERIDMNWDASILNARGVPDSADTTGKGFRGNPILIDEGEQYNGSTISYNFKTQKGKITLGQTEIEQGYYRGEAIKRAEKDVLFVENGRYTTCERDDPHYYFFSPKMKIIPNDKVVASPIYLYIGGVPVFALPFGVFPNHSGRRSGIIAPAYGDDFRRGRYLTHLGYYWAINDYTDLRTTFDWYSRGGWVAHSAFRYALRYNFSGSVAASFTNTHFGEELDPDRTKQQEYNIRIGHNQEFNPTTRMDVDFTFTSGSYYQNTSTNLGDLLRQNVISNATVYKTWGGANSSLTLNVYRDQNLQTGELSERLPSISFTRNQSFPFRRQQRGASSISPEEFRWYELIGYGYAASLINDRTKLKKKISGIKTRTPGVDTTQEVFERGNRQTLSQNISVNLSPKLANFTITPFFSFQDNRTYTQNFVPKLKPDSSGAEIVEHRDNRPTGFFSGGISTSTRFYGIFQPNVLGIGSFRHTVNPVLSFTYSKQIYDRDLAPRSMLASLSVGHLFEMKTAVRDTSEREKKIQLLNVGTSISYDFAKDSLKLSELSVSYRTNIGNLLSISGGSSFNFYKFDRISHTRVNKFLLSEGAAIAQLTNFSINLSTSLRGGKRAATIQTAEPRARTPLPGEESQYLAPSVGRPEFNIPWNLSLAFDYSLSRGDPTVTVRSSNLRGSLSFDLTQNWKISASANYDLISNQVAAPVINVYRDLHCWELNFNWLPKGIYRGFRLEIRVKAPQLQDLKLTKQGSVRSVY